ncbi:MAG: nuclear transport factor 2 family protein [Sphingobium sp.]
MNDMERRLRRLEDRAALDDLIVRYFLAADGDDPQGLADSFTQNASFASSGVVNAQGRAAIVDFIGTSRTHMGLTVHTPHYGLYSFIDDDRAEGLVGAHLELALAGEPLFGAVRYQDEYRRTPEGWRIARRDMRTIHIAPWSDVGQSLLSPTPVRWPGTAPAASDYPRK